MRNGTEVRGAGGKIIPGWPSWRIVVGVVALAGAGVIVAAWLVLPQRDPSKAAVTPEPAAVRLPDDLLSAPAYLPQAAGEDFKQEALRTADELLKSFPDGPDALAVAARLQYSLGHAHEAKSLWQLSCKIDPQFANAYVALGIIAKDSGDFSHAVEMFEKVVALVPTDHHTPPLLAEALMALGRVEEGIVVLDRHVHTQPVSAQAVVNLGLGYLELKQYDKARQTLEAVTKTYPDDPRAYYALAQLYGKLGEKQKAQESMEQFRSRSFVDDEALVRDRRGYEDQSWMRALLVKTLWEAGQAYRQLGSDNRAEEMWHKALFLDFKHIPCRRELLVMYEQHGRLSAAIRLAVELTQLEPDNAEHWFNLALLQARLDRLDDALQAIGHALRLDPNNARYRQVYELCRRGGRE